MINDYAQKGEGEETLMVWKVVGEETSYNLHGNSDNTPKKPPQDVLSGFCDDEGINIGRRNFFILFFFISLQILEKEKVCSPFARKKVPPTYEFISNGLIWEESKPLKRVIWCNKCIHSKMDHD